MPYVNRTSRSGTASPEELAEVRQAFAAAMLVDESYAVAMLWHARKIVRGRASARTRRSRREPCSVPGCNRLAVYVESGGLCQPHYYRLKTYGSPLAGKPVPALEEVTS